MIDGSFRLPPAQPAVAEHQLDILTFAFDAAMQIVEALKDSHGLASRPLRGGPGVPPCLPICKRGDSRRICIEAFRGGLRALCQGPERQHLRSAPRVFPTAFE